MIQPKYAIGQKVYAAKATLEHRQVQCPDCLGTKEWQAVTPSGESFHIPCGNCFQGYFARGTVTKYFATPDVVEMTIGSVRIDTEDEHPVSYMLKETGVGSGTVWNECDLSLDRETAMRTALAKAEAIRAKMQADEDRREREERKQSRRKPSADKRRIRELEKQLKELESVAKLKLIVGKNERTNHDRVL